jgi:proteic killer suppression protein
MEPFSRTLQAPAATKPGRNRWPAVSLSLDKRKATSYNQSVRIERFLHKGLKKLYFDDSTKGLPAEAVDKLRKMLAFLQAMNEEDELEAIPIWKAHRLTGNRKGVWSLHVSKNWRLTFWIDRRSKEIRDVNLEDYH